MLSVDIKLHLPPLWGCTPVQPLVIEDGIRVIQWLKDLVSILYIAEEQVETAKRLLARLTLVFA
jgi:hypothetical protein